MWGECTRVAEEVCESCVWMDEGRWLQYRGAKLCAVGLERGGCRGRGRCQGSCGSLVSHPWQRAVCVSKVRGRAWDGVGGRGRGVCVVAWDMRT